MRLRRLRRLRRGPGHRQFQGSDPPGL